MKVKMLSTHSGGKVEYNPGDIAEFDDAEGARLIAVGGAVADDSPVADEPAAPKKTDRK